MYLRFEQAAWAGEAAGEGDGWDDGAPEGVPEVPGGRCSLMPPLWEEDVPEGAEAAGTSGMKSETTVARRCRSVSEGSAPDFAGGMGYISLHPATPRGGDQAVMPTPRGRRRPPSLQGGGA